MEILFQILHFSSDTVLVTSFLTRRQFVRDGQLFLCVDHVHAHPNNDADP